MKKKFIYLFFSLIICLSDAQSQSTVSSKIMDAAIQWNGGAGTLKVFLTDIDGLIGLQVALKNSSDTITIYNAQYNISGTTFSSGGTVSPDHVLSVPIGSYATNADYYARIRVIMSNSSYNEIEIHTTN